MYINLFWLWGHPEVYLLVLPAFGVFSEIASTFSAKRIFGYASLVYATAVIGLLSFTVWLHHFFTMGASAKVNAVFGIATMIIAVPTGVKVFNWIFTMYAGRIRFTVPMLYLLGFTFTFVIGGMTGVIHAVPVVDYELHNTTFLIAHFHNMLIPGVLFGVLAGMNYWFPKAFGFRLDEKWGVRAFACWVIGFLLAFVPLYFLGLMGMPRRMQSYANPAYQPYLIIAFLGALVILAAIVCQAIQLIVSIQNRHALADQTGDPWDARTWEWGLSSPPTPYNFAVLPKIEDMDDFWEKKKQNKAYILPETFTDIVLPKNSYAAFFIGVGSFLVGFGAIWFMWWLFAIGMFVMFAAVVYRAFDDESDFIMPAAEVERLERAHLEAVKNAPPVPKADELVTLYPQGVGHSA